jgi:hypothetical protein
MIDPATIHQVYSGKAGRCCCGCCGNHSGEPRSIKLICGKLNKLAKQGYRLEDMPTYYSIDTETRRYIAYKTPA